MKRLTAILTLLLLLTACAAPDTPPEVEAPTSSEENPAPPVKEPKPASPVYTDWSKLTPYVPAEIKYTYFDPYSGSEPLQPRDDYGLLLSYVGTNSILEQYIMDKLPLYGLVTDKGQLVTEPVYTDISFLGEFLLLARGEVYGYHEMGWGTVADGGFAYTIAAENGSWVREIGAAHEVFSFGEDCLAASMRDGSVLVIRADGSTAAEFPRSALEPYLGADYEWSWDMGPTLSGTNGLLTIWKYDETITDGDYNVCYLNPATGEISAKAPAGWDDTVHFEEYEVPHVPGYGYLDQIVDSATGKVYYSGSRQEDAHTVYDLLNEDGQLIYAGCVLEDVYLWTPIVRAGLITSIDDGVFSYHSLADGSTVFSFPLRSNSD